MNFENALYYTLSTITQSLGGAIALLGAFVLLRYQMINSTLQSAGKTAMSGVILDAVTGRKILTYYIQGRYGHLCNLLRGPASAGLKRGNVLGADEAVAALGQIRLELRRRRQLMREFRVALITSIASMGLATLGLAYTPYIIAAKLESDVLIIAVAAFVITLIQFGFLLYRQLNQEVAESISRPIKQETGQSK